MVASGKNNWDGLRRLLGGKGRKRMAGDDDIDPSLHEVLGNGSFSLSAANRVAVCAGAFRGGIEAAGDSCERP